MKCLVLAGLIAFLSPEAAAQTRLASDFEIAQMRERLARSTDFLSRLSAHLNLGDLHAARRETTVARDEYSRALSIAMTERLASRRDSDLSRYATVTAYAGLASAKLEQSAASFQLLEEALRYSSDSAKIWNLYATAMTLLGKPAKSVAAARNAVALAAPEAARQSSSTSSRIDLAVYQHGLAAALIETDQTAEAEALLRGVIDSLSGPEFEHVRREITRAEAFEIYSTARGEAAAYLSLLNRSQLRLASLFERRGELVPARDLYARVLEGRSDDANALAALARLSRAEERARYFAAAFDANPFALSLVRSYQEHLRAGGTSTESASTAGGAMRQALERLHRGESHAARGSIDELLARFPGNETLLLLRREVDAGAEAPAFLTQRAAVIDPPADDLQQLASLAAAARLTPDQRAALDSMTFTSTVIFDESTRGATGQTIFQQGHIAAGMPFRFAEPTAFNGVFRSAAPLRLTYRFLGAIGVDGRDALLLEPLRLEEPR